MNNFHKGDQADDNRDRPRHQAAGRLMATQPHHKTWSAWHFRSMRGKLVRWSSNSPLISFPVCRCRRSCELS